MFKKLRNFPITIITTLVLLNIYFMEVVSGQYYSFLAIVPMNFNYLHGILTFPLKHGSLSHLFGNLSALVPLLAIIEYVYKKHAVLVFWFNYILSGTILWFIGREVPHVGASGIVYAFSFFTITAGLLSGNRRFAVLVFVVLILNNGLLWGMLPIKQGVSWDGHLSGAIAGVLVAVLLRRMLFSEVKDEEEYSNISVSDEFDFEYDFIEEEKENEKT